MTRRLPTPRSSTRSATDAFAPGRAPRHINQCCAWTVAARARASAPGRTEDQICDERGADAPGAEVDEQRLAGGTDTLRDRLAHFLRRLRYFLSFLNIHLVFHGCFLSAGRPMAMATAARQKRGKATAVPRRDQNQRTPSRCATRTRDLSLGVS